MEKENTVKADTHVEVEVRSGYTWITLPGTLSMDNYQLIERQIESRLEGKPNNVVLDLIYFRQLFSTGLSLILRLNKKIVESGGSLWLVNVSDKCREYLTSIKLDKVLPFFNTDLEFEILGEESREKTQEHNNMKFVCITNVEKGVCYINILGSMTIEYNLSRCNKTIYKKKIKHYAFDLTGLDMIDSSGACALRDVVSVIKHNKAECVAFGSNRVINKLLKLLSIDRILPLYDNERQALNALKETE